MTNAFYPKMIKTGYKMKTNVLHKHIQHETQVNRFYYSH